MDTQELQRLKARYDIVGNDAEFNRAIETAARIAPTDLTVLITGESGVGKDALPQIIHSMSRRRNGKYLAVNCGAIPEGTINAELFGHEKGAFTGAIGERKGYFEEADGGTLFLDEIGELPKETQALLLRVLQNGEFMKVGSSKVEKTDVRIIAATNVNLWNAVERGTFRKDLYYRLNAVQITVPSLRERKDDIYLLFRKFTSDISEKYNLCKVTLTHDAIALLRAYRWPGNIRQLKNVTEAITSLESRPVTPQSERLELDSTVIRRYIPDEKDTLLPATADAAAGSGSSFADEDKRMIIKALLDLKQEVDDLKRRMGAIPAGQAVATDIKAAAPAKEDDDAEWQEQFEEPQASEPVSSPEPLSIRKANDELIQRALEKHGGKVKEAAAELGISERTIYRKLARQNGR